MNPRSAAWIAALAGGALAFPARAVDPPHLLSNNCGSCHIPHNAPGGDLAAVAGNANLCLSCHTPGGVASAQGLANADQALPWPGLAAGQNPVGTSHRWDARVAGQLAFVGGAIQPSTGTLRPAGRFIGPYAKTYTITIATAGDVGIARFNWSATTPGGGAGTNLLSAAVVGLDEGISVEFHAGTSPSFQAGDRWTLRVRPGLRDPTNTTLLLHMADGTVICSACHDEHRQERAPFDPAAPAYAGPGTGVGRQFMRVDNDRHQLCLDCHIGHNATNATAGSHPVGIPVPADATHRPPATLPREAGTGDLGCLTCHTVHHAPTSDGKVLRLTNSLTLCVDCHTLADTLTPAAHFSITNANTRWPGGKLGSLMPARPTAGDNGTCLNCHAVHGWPDAASPTNTYPHLLADFEENLCFTCHGTTGPAARRVQADFAKARHHPVANSQQTAGRKVECTDCHNEHKAQSGTRAYTATATATRNRVANTLKGVSGVAVGFSGLGNFVAPPANKYILVGAAPGATNEFEICFKCHSAYAWGTRAPPRGQSPNGTAANPVETDLAQEFSPANRSGHPIVTGLDNYPNSTVVGGRKGLLATALKAPWNVNIGRQTMTCSDCHNTDAASPAAQGPHGSAAQFMLRGPNAANWPNVTLVNYNSSWCANCHLNSAGDPHGEGGHENFPCYYCHIVIPHGGKVSRLVADNDSMPARYAYNNTLDTNSLQAFTKRAIDAYGASNCKAQCHGTGPHRTTNPTENW